LPAVVNRAVKLAWSNWPGQTGLVKLAWSNWPGQTGLVKLVWGSAATEAM
jgi:hypothetical protein